MDKHLCLLRHLQAQWWPSLGAMFSYNQHWKGKHFGDDIHPKKYARNWQFGVFCWSFIRPISPISFRVTSPALSNCMIAQVPVKQPWGIWVNTAYTFSQALLIRPHPNKAQHILWLWDILYHSSIWSRYNIVHTVYHNTAYNTKITKVDHWKRLWSKKKEDTALFIFS